MAVVPVHRQVQRLVYRAHQRLSINQEGFVVGVEAVIGVVGGEAQVHVLAGVRQRWVAAENAAVDIVAHPVGSPYTVTVRQLVGKSVSIIVGEPGGGVYLQEVGQVVLDEGQGLIEVGSGIVRYRIYICEYIVAASSRGRRLGVNPDAEGGGGDGKETVLVLVLVAEGLGAQVGGKGLAEEQAHPLDVVEARVGRSKGQPHCVRGVVVGVQAICRHLISIFEEEVGETPIEVLAIASAVPTVELQSKGRDACAIGRDGCSVLGSNSEGVDSALVNGVATVNLYLVLCDVHWVHDYGLISFVEGEPVGEHSGVHIGKGRTSTANSLSLLGFVVRTRSCEVIPNVCDLKPLAYSGCYIRYVL